MATLGWLWLLELVTSSGYFDPVPGDIGLASPLLRRLLLG